MSRSTWPTAALGALVTLGALVALTGTAGAQQNLAGATQLELTVTVKPGGGTAVTGAGEPSAESASPCFVSQASSDSASAASRFMTSSRSVTSVPHESWTNAGRSSAG